MKEAIRSTNSSSNESSNCLCRGDSWCQARAEPTTTWPNTGM